MADSLQALQLVQDQTAKSESYYCHADGVVVTDEIITWLKDKLATSPGNTVRICLHRDAASVFHEMLIAHKRTGRFHPHKHLQKSESYHVIEGRLRVQMFDDEGRATTSVVLGAQGSGHPFMYRIPVNVWHSTEPDGDYVVFHESKPGPFVSTDNVYPDWKHA
jgi:cupin fold WbuC family metalloprotein